MHRKRHEDNQQWHVRLYRYRIYLKGGHRFFDLPEAVQGEVQSMRAYWNTLTTAAAHSSERYQQILASSPAVADALGVEQKIKAQVEDLWATIKAIRQRTRSLKSESEALLKDDLTDARQRLKQARLTLKQAKAEARETRREELARHHESWDAYLREQRKTPTLQWGNREYLLDTFKTALGKARKEGVQLKERSGRVTSVHFRQPYTSGLPTAKLLKHQGRIRFAATEKSHRLTGSFLAGTERLAFDCVYHRPLPVQGLIKYVDLIGNEYAKGGGRLQGTQYRSCKPLWEWHIVVAVEFPPLPLMRRSADKIAGLDLGWRQKPDGSLRIGYLVESEGHERELCLPPPLRAEYARTIALQEQIDTLTEEMAIQLRQLGVAETSEEARQLLAYPHMTRPKMFALLRLVESYPEARALCEQWASDTTKLYWQQRNLLRYCGQYRNDMYRKLATALCREYKSIVIEEMDLRPMRTKATKEGKHALVLAEHFGRFANLSFFRRALTEAARKTGTELPTIPAYHTTVPCHICGEIVENTGALSLSCSRGHQWDQDANAGKNLLLFSAGPLPRVTEYAEFAG